MKLYILALSLLATIVFCESTISRREFTYGMHNIGSAIIFALLFSFVLYVAFDDQKELASLPIVCLLFSIVVSLVWHYFFY